MWPEIRSKQLAITILLAGMLLSASRVRADVTGAILGTVADPTGAVVPGAKITLRNAHTGLARETVTDIRGAYEFLAVPVGEDYAVEVELKGFEKAQEPGIKLLVNQNYRADFRLAVGTVTQTINVLADLAPVETTSTQLGDVIEDKKMTDLPLNGRSYLDLMGLQAGVATISSQGGGSMSVNGSRVNAVSFMVNGGAVEATDGNSASVVPTLDSIQEFRLVTNSFDAEYGYYSGAQVNAITKSGSNQLHGDAFDFLRNDEMDSRNFFDSARGIFQQNQFGGTAGGAILKNRLFFFGDYQGTRSSRGLSSGNINVPSVAERGGDFSDVAKTTYPAVTGSVRGDSTPGAFAASLSAKLGYTVTPGEAYWVSGCNTAANAQAGMCVFPGQVIPSAAFNPAAKGTLSFIPDPNGGGNGSRPVYATSGLKSTTTEDKWAPRIDLVNKATGNWSFYYNYDKNDSFSPSVSGISSTYSLKTHQATMSNTHIFGPTAVNEVRLNFTRRFTPGTLAANGLGKVSTWGFVEGGLGIIPSLPQLAGVPGINLAATGFSFGGFSADLRAQNAYEAIDTFSTILGQHTMKFGGSFRFVQYNRRGGSGPNGDFTFDGSETGNDFADYLLGALATIPKVAPSKMITA